MPPGMRVVIAPASFGLLGPAPAADAMAAGWLDAVSGTEVVRCPVTDGGAGMVDAIRQSRGGTLLDQLAASATPGGGRALLVDGTGYVEGADVGAPSGRSGAVPGSTGSTHDLGLRIRRVLDAGAERLVIGLADCDAFDGGAGLLQALGTVVHGPEGPLRPSAVTGARLLEVRSIDVSGLDRRLAGTPIAVAAPPVDVLGIAGAAVEYGKGRPELDVPLLDRGLGHWADVVAGALPLGTQARTVGGAGSAGGAGLVLAALGGSLSAGAELLAAEVGLAHLVESAGLVVTGERTYDWSSLRPPAPVAVVAATAAGCAVPCVVLAEQVLAGRRETAVAGVDATYPLAAIPAADGPAAEHLASRLRAAAARAARDWGR